MHGLPTATLRRYGNHWFAVRLVTSAFRGIESASTSTTDVDRWDGVSLQLTQGGRWYRWRTFIAYKDETDLFINENMSNLARRILW